MTRLRWTILGILGVTAVLIALYWQEILLSLAMSTAESRPSLLVNARWNDAESPPAFRSTFPSGKPEQELLDWLKANEFEVHAERGMAQRTIRSLPCNERVVVNWRSAGGRLSETKATVREAGCL
jgi:hypothetical protein